MLKAGHEFRDKDGVLVATLTHDLHVGDLLLANHFVLADGEQPGAGDLVPSAVMEELARHLGA